MPPEPTAGVSQVSLSVRDLDLSLKFYRDVLGLDVFVDPFEGTAFHGREAMLRVGRVVLCLQAHRANDGSPFDPTRTGLARQADRVGRSDPPRRAVSTQSGRPPSQPVE